MIVRNSDEELEVCDAPTTKWTALADKVVREQRVEVTVLVTMESDSNFFLGFTENLSEGGVFVATHASSEIGSSVDLVIMLADQEPIRARGKVRWLREYSEANGTVPGMGIRFDGLSPSDGRRISEFTMMRAPLFFDDENERESLNAAWASVG